MTRQLWEVCEHGEVKKHVGSGYMRDGRWHTVNEGISCPGGRPVEGETVWWCEVHRASGYVGISRCLQSALPDICRVVEATLLLPVSEALR